MPTDLQILFQYYRENVRVPKSQTDEEEEKAYKLLEASFHQAQRKLFNEWEDLHMFQRCEEIYFWFEYGFKKGAEFLQELNKE